MKDYEKEMEWNKSMLKGYIIGLRQVLNQCDKLSYDELKVFLEQEIEHRVSKLLGE